MTLEEAIAHHEWAAENSEGEVSREHERYVSWLTQLRLARENMFSVEIPQMAQTIHENHKLQEENAKLREFIDGGLLHDAMENVCSKSYWCDKKNWQTCNDKSCGNHFYVELARELGVEI